MCFRSEEFKEFVMKMGFSCLILLLAIDKEMNKKNPVIRVFYIFSRKL